MIYLGKNTRDYINSVRQTPCSAHFHLDGCWTRKNAQQWHIEPDTTYYQAVIVAVPLDGKVAYIENQSAFKRLCTLKVNPFPNELCTKITLEGKQVLLERSDGIRIQGAYETQEAAVNDFNICLDTYLCDAYVFSGDASKTYMRYCNDAEAIGEIWMNGLFVKCKDWMLTFPSKSEQEDGLHVNINDMYIDSTTRVTRDDWCEILENLAVSIGQVAHIDGELKPTWLSPE